MTDRYDQNIDALALVMQSVLDAVVAVDAEGSISAWNEIAEKTFGWSAEEAVGQSLGDLIVPPQHRAGHAAGMRRFHDTGIARVVGRRIEITAVNKAGVEFPVELAIVATPNLNGTAFVGFLRDISGRRAEQDSLKLSEESLRLTTEAAEVGIWDLDLTTNVLNWSVRTKAMFGISPEATCTMDDFYGGLHPDDLEATTLAFGLAVDPEKKATYDVTYRTIGKEDGVVRWVAAKGRGVFDGDRCIRAVGTAIDITARKLADERNILMLKLSDILRGQDANAALREACALIGGYFQVVRVGFGQLDQSNDIFTYNVCWTDGTVPPLLGKFPAAAFGEKIVEKLSGGATVVINDLFSDSLSDEPATRETASSVDTRSILVVPFLTAGQLRTIVYLNDSRARDWTSEQISFMEELAERTRQVIARGEAEDALRVLNSHLEARVEERTHELRLAEEALRQSQKMEAVGQLTGGIAHDFNNLLAGISGSLELLAKRLAEGRTTGVERYLSSAQEASRRAAALTQRLLAFSRRQTLDPRPLDVNRLIAGMEDLVRRSVGPDVAVEVVQAGGLWTTKIDGPQLENALLNLCINARDAMAPGGGRLTVETANKWLDDRAARDRDLAPGQYVSLCVTDTGTGMTQEVIDRAFDPFFTTKPLGQGTGLGLSMVYGFVRQSGGQVRIYSELGVGTTMCLYLPRYVGAAADAQARPKQDLVERGDGETILVVDDEPILRMLILDVLGENGYRAIEAEDGASALKVLDSNARIDLLITDVGLPGGMNGRQVADAGRRSRPDLKVLFITGYAENAVVGNGHLAPGMEIITKPFEIAALGRKVQDMIAR